MAPEVESDPTVAGAMRGLSTLRLLAHHLQGLPSVSLSVEIHPHSVLTPTLAIQVFRQDSPAELVRLADSLGLPTPSGERVEGDCTVYKSEGPHHGYTVRLTTVVLDSVESIAARQAKAASLLEALPDPDGLREEYENDWHANG